MKRFKRTMLLLFSFLLCMSSISCGANSETKVSSEIPAEQPATEEPTTEEPILKNLLQKNLLLKNLLLNVRMNGLMQAVLNLNTAQNAG